MVSSAGFNSRRGNRSGRQGSAFDWKLSRVLDRFENIIGSEVDEELPDDLIAEFDAVTPSEFIESITKISDSVDVSAGSESAGTLDSLILDRIRDLLEQSMGKINNSKNTASFNEPVSFSLTREQRSLDGLITGDRDSGSEAVRGTQGDDVIGDGVGRDMLFGLGGADDFVFDDAEAFGRKQADLIKDYSVAEGDRLLLDDAVFGEEASLGVAESRRQLKQMINGSDFDLLYFEPKGRLFFNENGVERGFGDGGLLCTMKNAGEITTDQIVLV